MSFNPTSNSLKTAIKPREPKHIRKNSVAGGDFSNILSAVAPTLDPSIKAAATAGSSAGNTLATAISTVDNSALHINQQAIGVKNTSSNSLFADPSTIPGPITKPPIIEPSPIPEPGGDIFGDLQQMLEQQSIRQAEFFALQMQAQNNMQEFGAKTNYSKSLHEAAMMAVRNLKS